MLNPNTDRLDYGQLLTPPEGYELDFAVGTTYSLDLDALVGATFALGLSEETDSEILNNPICLLEALRATGDKVALFCEAGQIHLPNKVTSLYILLEKMVQGVNVKRVKSRKQYPSFHPKLWVIRYLAQGELPLYRVIVLSRNLTFDRSWDVAYSMDGLKKGRKLRKNDGLCDFLNYLVDTLPKAEENNNKRRAIKSMIKDLPYVRFEIPDKEFNDYEFIPCGVKAWDGSRWSIDNYPIFNEPQHEIFIISPFLSNDIIKRLNEAKGYHIENYDNTLITRASSLGRINPESVSSFNIYIMKDGIVDGEEMISEEEKAIQKQDIHAKLYMTRKDSRSDIYIGSLNASSNAVYNNIEFMLRLMSANRYLNTEKLKEDLFCGNEENKDNPFKRVFIEDFQMDDKEGDSVLLEAIIKRISRSNPIGKVIEGAELFSIIITFDSNLELNGEVLIRPLFSNKSQSISEIVEFSNIDLTKLSEFFVIKVSDGENTVERIVKIPLENMPKNREKEIVRSVFDNKADNFYKYIAFLLGENTTIGSLEMNEGESGFIQGESYGKIAIPALYEKMLQAAFFNPGKLKGIEYLIEMVEDDGVIPSEFIKLYNTIKKAAKIDA